MSSPVSLYLIQSLDNGGVYVGISVSPRRRWKSHRADVRKRASPLYASMRKYGAKRHTFAVMEEHPTYAEALEAEQWMIAYLRSLGARVFNLTDGGEGALGYRHTPETRQRLSESHKGKTLSAEHRAKISESHMGLTANEATRIKMRARRLPPETLARIADANRRRWADPDFRSRVLASRAEAMKVRKAG